MWLDASGEIWADHGSGGSPATLALGGVQGTERLVVGRGTQLAFQRRKAEWQGWETLVPRARNAWAYNAGDVEYARALKAVLGLAA